MCSTVPSASFEKKLVKRQLLSLAEYDKAKQA